MNKIDTSCSMYSPDYLPFDVAVSIGFLISRATKGKFKNHMITFSDVPEFAIINDRLYSTVGAR